MSREAQRVHGTAVLFCAAAGVAAGSMIKSRQHH
jgi:hypothetical protein